MTKNKLNIAILLAASTLCAASCNSYDIAPRQQEPGPAASSKSLITFAAGCADQALQKTAYQAGEAGTVAWINGDRISIFPVGTTSNDLGTVINANGASCQITGLTDNASGYYALYPFDSEVICNYGKISGLKIPSKQVAAAGQYDPKADIMLAYTTSEDMMLNFKHVGAKLGITVPISNVKTIKICCSQYIAGTASVSFSVNPGDVPSNINVTSGSKSITLTCADDEGFQKGETYYACLFPTSGSSQTPDKIRITFYTNDAMTQGSYYKANIAGMQRAKRHAANPSNATPHDVEAASIDMSSLSSTLSGASATATKVVFGYIDEYDTENMTLLTDNNNIGHYQDGNGVHYFLSDSEISPSQISYLFQGNTVLEEVEISNLNTSSITDFGYLFHGCTSLRVASLNGLNTSSAQKLTCMFQNCESLSSIDLSGFDTRNVTNYSGMFNTCKSLSSLDLSSFTYLNGPGTYTYRMFYGCSNLATIIATHSFDITSRGENNADMFFLCERLTGGSGSNYGDHNPPISNGKSAHIDGGPSNPGFYTEKQ